MKKILIFSNFGKTTGALGGQTIKADNLYKLLKKKSNKENFKVDYFDTDIFSKKQFIFFSLIILLKKLLSCNTLIFSGSKKSLKIAFPFLYSFGFLFRKKIHYIVVGGWLSDFLDKNPFYLKLLKRIEMIYPENDSLCLQLKKKHHLINVTKLNNFRVTNIKPNKKTNDDINIKMVFMARVSEEKGVKTLFELEKDLLKKNHLNFIIDIYGPIDTKFKNKFETLLSQSKSKIKYNGIINPEHVYHILSNYDFMLFPTRYSGEGFPGSILDAFICGLPIVASNWKYASEIIDNKETGLISKFKDDKDFINKCLILIKNPDLLNNLRKNSIAQSHLYNSDSTWKILSKHILK